MIFCFRFLPPLASSKLYRPVEPNFASWSFCDSLFNKTMDILFIHISEMNGILIVLVSVLLLYIVYLLALVYAWYQSRAHRLQRGTLGLPDVDSNQAPRSYPRIFGDLLYAAVLFFCRLFPQN